MKRRRLNPTAEPADPGDLTDLGDPTDPADSSGSVGSALPLMQVTSFVDSFAHSHLDVASVSVWLRQTILTIIRR
nr:hypothetical protein OH820_29725 [Streptomyces sp. NBC_00857]